MSHRVETSGARSGRLQQRDDISVQDLGKPVQDLQRGILQLAFQLADIGPVNVGVQRQLLLGDPLQSTQALQVGCQHHLHLLELRVPLHGRELRRMKTEGPQDIVFKPISRCLRWAPTREET